MYQLERTAKILFKFKDAFNVRDSSKAVLEYVDDAVSVNIPAYKGDKGDKGDPGPSPIYQYSVPSVGDLAAIAEGLTEAEAGYWYGVDGSSSGWIWNGRDLVERENFIGQKGDKGDMPNLVGGTFSSGPAPGGSVEEVSPGNYRINVVSQKGDKGDKGDRGATGPAASIASAADFTAAAGVAAGDVVVRKADGTYTTAPPRVPTTYFLPSSQFADLIVPKGSPARKDVLARISLPGQPFAYRPSVLGRVIADLSPGTRLEVYVVFRTPIGGPVTVPPEGTTCSYALTGSFGGSQPISLLPYYQETDPISPGSPVATIPANTPMEFFVISNSRFPATDAGFNILASTASLEITCIPV